MDDQQYAYLSNSIEYSIGFFVKYVSKCDITQYFEDNTIGIFCKDF